MLIFIQAVLFGLSAFAGLPFEGEWHGSGTAWVSGAPKQVESTITVLSDSVVSHEVSDGYSSIEMNWLKSQPDGTFAWFDPKSNPVGAGACHAKICTFLGTFKVGEDSFTISKIFFYSESQLHFSETTSGPNFRYIKQLVLTKVIRAP